MGEVVYTQLIYSNITCFSQNSCKRWPEICKSTGVEDIISCKVAYDFLLYIINTFNKKCQVSPGAKIYLLYIEKKIETKRKICCKIK